MFLVNSFAYHFVRKYCFQTSDVKHQVPKCISCHKAIVVITGRAHCFHDYIYIMPIMLLLKFEHSVCQRSLLTTIYGDFGQVKRRINQLVSPGDFFRLETLQDSEIFRIVFLDVVIFNVIYYHDGVLSSFGVDSIPTVIKICISTIFWIKYDAYGTYLLRHH